MKLILLTAIIAVAYTTVGPLALTTEKYDGTLTCKMSIDIGTAGTFAQSAGGAIDNVVYLFDHDATADALTSTSTGAQCIIATEVQGTASRRSLTDQHTILAATTGTCSNFTATDATPPVIVVGSAWTASTYGFNCTAATNAAFNTLDCALYFDMGTTHIDLPTGTTIKAAAHLVGATETAADVASATALTASTFTAGTDDKACEDKSSATATAFAGAAALVGSALFF